MAKIDTLFMTKTAENHTLWGRVAKLPILGSNPPPGEFVSLQNQKAAECYPKACRIISAFLN